MSVLLPIANDIDVFFGDANPAEARVYARLDPADGGPHATQLTLEGHIAGPDCQFAKTLPAKISLLDRGPGGSVLLEAVIPDPCFWTPETPFLYRAKLDIRWAEHSEKIDRLMGIRRLGNRDQSLFLDGRRWVARGVAKAQVTVSDLAAARAAESVLAVDHADDRLCAEASRLGVPLLVNLIEAGPGAEAETRRLGQWPAVFAVMLNPETLVTDEMRKRAPNLLLATRMPETGPVSVPGWAQLIVCRSDRLPELLEWQTSGDRRIPIVVLRRHRDGTANASIENGRRQCDQLQFDMANIGDFAGYIIELP